MVAVYAMLARGDDAALHMLVQDQTYANWLFDGFPKDPPGSIAAYWESDDSLRRTEFPSFAQGYPVLSKRVAEAVRDEFGEYGYFIPVDLRHEGTGAYEMYVPTDLVDCLDRERSSEPEGWLEIIQRVVFVRDKIPTSAPAFRIPESREFVFWNEWAAKKIVELVGEDDIEVRLVWSDVPGATPHPDPMNI